LRHDVLNLAHHLSSVATMVHSSSGQKQNMLASGSPRAVRSPSAPPSPNLRSRVSPSRTAPGAVQPAGTVATTALQSRLTLQAQAAAVMDQAWSSTSSSSSDELTPQPRHASSAAPGTAAGAARGGSTASHESQPASLHHQQQHTGRHASRSPSPSSTPLQHLPVTAAVRRGSRYDVGSNHSGLLHTSNSRSGSPAAGTPGPLLPTSQAYTVQTPGTAFGSGTASGGKLAALASERVLDLDDEVVLAGEGCADVHLDTTVICMLLQPQTPTA
jgi:hypothetical protein